MRLRDQFEFNVFWSDEDNSYVVTSPLYPGLMAFGDTVEEAIREAEIALEGIIECLREER